MIQIVRLVSKMAIGSKLLRHPNMFLFDDNLPSNEGGLALGERTREKDYRGFRELMEERTGKTTLPEYHKVTDTNQT